MAELTLLPAAQARVGARFTYLGENTGDECDACPVRELCYRLTAGRHYRVVEVRERSHPCDLHDGDRAYVCRVQEVTFRTSLETKHLRGTAAHWKPIPCGFPECENYRLCHPLVKAERFEIVRDLGRMECPMHYEIHKVRLKPLD